MSSDHVQAIALIVAAVITTAGPLWVQLRRLRRENTLQHDVNAHVLVELLAHVREVRAALDHHIEWEENQKYLSATEIDAAIRQALETD